MAVVAVAWRPAAEAMYAPTPIAALKISADLYVMLHRSTFTAGILLSHPQQLSGNCLAGSVDERQTSGADGAVGVWPLSAHAHLVVFGIASHFEKTLNPLCRATAVPVHMS